MRRLVFTGEDADYLDDVCCHVHIAQTIANAMARSRCWKVLTDDEWSQVHNGDSYPDHVMLINEAMGIASVLADAGVLYQDDEYDAVSERIEGTNRAIAVGMFDADLMPAVER